MEMANVRGIDLRALLQGGSLEVLIDEEPAPPAEAAPSAGVHLGIVSMIKKPSNFETWLHYHAEDVGVCRFYLRIEETPELQSLLCTPPYSTLVHAEWAGGCTRDWTGLATRQAMHMRDVIDVARSDGVTHLLHIDDDELLFLPNGQAALRSALASEHSAVSLHVRNLEALAPSARCTNPFGEASMFRHRPWEYGSYGYPPCSGKSFASLVHEDVAPNGPHHFGTAGTAHRGLPLPDGRSTTLPPGLAVILHYESASYKTKP